MNKAVALVGGVGLGAALMYFFDADRGRKRRTKAVDKTHAALHRVTNKAVKTNRDLRNRVQGLLAETKGIFRRDDVIDEVLVDRVRAKLGRVCSTMGSLNVDAHDGVVTLRGAVPVGEVQRILRTVRFVRGVKEIDNQLRPTDGSEQALATGIS